MWGCEIGANEHGVVGGNEAVSSLLSDELGDEMRLLGMDLLRLALERGGTANEAVQVLCALLEVHGQGGACEEGGDWTYENGFLLADAHEAFVVETCGVHHWAVERVPPGKGRNISNGLSIRAVDLCSDGLQDLCVSKGWWDPAKGPFDWKMSVGEGDARRAHEQLDLYGRERAGFVHLQAARASLAEGTLAVDDAQGWVKWMMGVLRDDDSGICFRSTHGFMSTGSQISWLGSGSGSGGGNSGGGSGGGASHFFTAASDPLLAAYKRFEFGAAAEPMAAQAQPTPTDHRSLELWQRWREIDLKGGMARCTSSKKAAKSVGDGLQAIEQEGLEALSGSIRRPTFAEAVARELALVAAAAKV